MESQEDEIEKKHHLLLEKFLEKGDINSFKKMLNIQTNLKQKPKNVSLIHSLKSNNNYKKYNSNNYLKTEEYSPLDIYSGYSKYESSSYLDRKLPFKDSEYSYNCLKGNYKSYSRKFDRIKMNWAKRRGISYENFQVPKLDSFIKNHNKLLDGNLFGKENNENIIYENELLRRNKDIMNNYMDSIRLSQSLKLPKIDNSYNHNRNNSNNYTLNL
jgi:hypothetical protein